MTGKPVPDAVKQLISNLIDSIPELEAILLLRDYREQSWTAERAGARLYVSKAIAGHILAVLEDRGFFTKEGEAYRYAPASPSLEQAIDELADAYAHHLVDVTHLVHAKPSASVREFAAAFRFRKEK
jgi:hypothetical protein